MNESVKQVDVLTEEELKEYEQMDEVSFLSFTSAKKIITSHRTLNSRNAKLVHENDELMAENVKLKALLKEKNGIIAELKLKNGGTNRE